MVFALTAPSQLIGRARMLFCKDRMYAGGSSDMVCYGLKGYSLFELLVKVRQIEELEGFQAETGTHEALGL